jgi:transcription elongation factor Elf1
MSAGVELVTMSEMEEEKDVVKTHASARYEFACNACGAVSSVPALVYTNAKGHQRARWSCRECGAPNYDLLPSDEEDS